MKNSSLNLAGLLAAALTASGGTRNGGLGDMIREMQEETQAGDCTCGQCGIKGNVEQLKAVAAKLVDKYQAKLIEDLTKDLPGITEDNLISIKGGLGASFIEVEALVRIGLKNTLLNANGMTPEQQPLVVRVAYTFTPEEQAEVAAARGE